MPTDPSPDPQPSEEAKNLARKILLPIIERSEDCRMPASVAQRMSVPAIALYIDEALDRVSAQALERAAKEVEKFGGPLNVYSDVAASVRALKPGGK